MTSKQEQTPPSKIEVDIIGVINDTKFKAKGTGSAKSGTVSLRLDYSEVPEGWHPLVYSDPLINLSYLKEINDARCLGMLTDTKYRAERVFDFGKGYQLRSLAQISKRNNVAVGAYSMTGTVRVPNLIDVEPFEEVMIPSGPGTALGIGMLRFKTENKEIIEAVASTRYFFDQGLRIPFTQIRRTESICKADKGKFDGKFKVTVQPMPNIHKDGPYLGHFCE